VTAFGVTTPGPPRRRRIQHPVALLLLLTAVPVVLGIAAGEVAVAGKAGALPAFAVIVLPVIAWRRPQVAPAVLLFAALTIDQFPNAIDTTAANVTGNVPLFHGLGSLHLAPADLLLLAAGMLALVRRSAQPAPPAPLSAAALGICGAVFVGVAAGMLHHGDVRVMFMETRPYVYLVATYLIARTLLTDRRAIHQLLWAIVIAEAFKSVQALAIFRTARHMDPRPEAVLGHEDALFLGIFVLLTASLWLFDVRGRLRTAATWLLPLVLAADLANTRRAAWLVLGGGGLVAAVIAAKWIPQRRLPLMRVGAVVLVVCAVYMPLFWNKSGGLAQPARAVRSIVSPGTRDASSDLYRVQEDANLKLNIREGGPLGRGFGVKIDYPLPIADISGLDPLIAYIPHDGVLYVLMRMGIAGGVALWTLVGVGIICACRLARSRERELAAVGALVAAMLIGYAMEGGIDQGFFFYRVGFVVGTLLGAVEAARRLVGTGPMHRAASNDS
jgi:acyl dehydratase